MDCQPVPLLGAVAVTRTDRRDAGRGDFDHDSTVSWALAGLRDFKPEGRPCQDVGMHLARGVAGAWGSRSLQAPVITLHSAQYACSQQPVGMS